MIEKALKMNTNNNNELFLSYCYSIILCLSLERVYKVFNSETCNDAPSILVGASFSFLHLTNSCKRALWPMGHDTTATTTRLQPMDRYSSLPFGDLQHFSRKAHHQPESLPHSSHIRSHLRRQIRNLGLAATSSGCNFFLADSDSFVPWIWGEGTSKIKIWPKKRGSTKDLFGKNPPN
jgi:hypothetical protein